MNSLGNNVQISIGIGNEVKESAVQLSHMVGPFFLLPFFGSRSADCWTRTERCVCGDWRNIIRHISTDEPHGSATGRSLDVVHAVSGVCWVDFFLRVDLSIAVRRRVLCLVSCISRKNSIVL